MQKKNRRYNLYTGACDRKVGYTVLQKKYDGTTKPIGYYSMILADGEKNLDTKYHECFSVVTAVLWLRPFWQHTDSSSERITMNSGQTLFLPMWLEN